MQTLVIDVVQKEKCSLVPRIGNAIPPETASSYCAWIGLFRDVKKAVPVPDVGFLTTNSSKGTAMSGQAAKITFHRNSLSNSKRSFTRCDGIAAGRASCKHYPSRFLQAQQLADRCETRGGKTLRRKMEETVAKFLRCIVGDRAQ